MLRSADPQQLYPELTDRLLRDLKNNLEPQGGCACRAVIFIDTFEAISLGLPGRAQRHEPGGVGAKPACSRVASVARPRRT